MNAVFTGPKAGCQTRIDTETYSNPQPGARQPMNVKPPVPLTGKEMAVFEYVSGERVLSDKPRRKAALTAGCVAV